jgi:hypothetical protein
MLHLEYRMLANIEFVHGNRPALGQEEVFSSIGPFHVDNEPALFTMEDFVEGELGPALAGSHREVYVRALWPSEAARPSSRAWPGSLRVSSPASAISRAVVEAGMAWRW